MSHSITNRNDGAISFEQTVLFEEADRWSFHSDVYGHVPVIEVHGAIFARKFSATYTNEHPHGVNPDGNVLTVQKPKRRVDDWSLLILRPGFIRATPISFRYVKHAEDRRLLDLMTLIGQYPLPTETFITFR